MIGRGGGSDDRLLIILIDVVRSERGMWGICNTLREIGC
jgi:hypothetical protein